MQGCVVIVAHNNTRPHRAAQPSVVTAAAAVKQSDVSTSRSRKNIHFNTSTVRSPPATPAGGAPDRGYMAPRNDDVGRRPGRGRRRQRTSLILKSSNMTAVDRQRWAATSCLLILRRCDDNGVMEPLTTTTTTVTINGLRSAFIAILSCDT